MSIFVVVSEEAEEEETQTLTMGGVILVCVFVGHIKESVHKWVSHEHEVKVLEHFNELILTSTLLEVTVGNLTTTSELTFLLD